MKLIHIASHQKYRNNACANQVLDLGKVSSSQNWELTTHMLYVGTLQLWPTSHRGGKLFTILGIHEQISHKYCFAARQQGSLTLIRVTEQGKGKLYHCDYEWVPEYFHPHQAKSPGRMVVSTSEIIWE